MSAWGEGEKEKPSEKRRREAKRGWNGERIQLRPGAEERERKRQREEWSGSERGRSPEVNKRAKRQRANEREG